MFKEEIHTQIDIEAKIDHIWNILTDLEAYSQWNPMIRKASGEVRTNARITLRFEPAGKRGHTFRPKLITVNENRELRWLGNPRIPGVLDSEHYFIFEEMKNGKVRMLHGMDFFGLVIPIIKRIIHNNTIEPFKAMNRALKERAEQD